MGFVVVHRGEMSEPQYRTYLQVTGRRLLSRGVGYDCVPRTHENGQDGHWLYVSTDEDDARGLAEELRSSTEDEGWQVQTVEGTPSEGPLCPLGIELCRQRTGFAVGLDPLTEWALETRFPGALRYEQVFVNADLREHAPTTQEIRELVVDVLPLLVRLQPDVRRAFGGYEVIDPVTQDVLVARAPFQD
jgi:hypothetical protein